ncbi:MAG: hypothetical protein II272_01275, partial [Oscillospiraceae bacterium]|nr:hypothetical protein [Oscillospiraceae bacterium]
SGYDLLESKKCHYPVPQRWKYKNTECKNTFVFSGMGKNVTLYYQPVIFDYNSHRINGIGLYRNNTISLNHDNKDERRGRYYVPDYVIKANINGSERYIILDAKFSSLATVKREYVADLSFKYLFSVSTVAENRSVDGLCVIYGQCFNDTDTQTVYDKQISTQGITPFADLIPFIEGVNDLNHNSVIQQLLSKIGI